MTGISKTRRRNANGALGRGERGEVEWDSTSVSPRRHEIRWNEWIATRLDSTREILVDERRGEERSRCCPFRRLGFISRLLLENTRETEGGEGGVIERERKRMENSGEKSGREGREEKETNYARVVVFRGCIVGKEWGGEQFSQPFGPTSRQAFPSSFQPHADETLSFLPRRIVR